MLTWQENPEVESGDGITRAVPGEPTQPYTLMVKLPGARPMRLTLQAESYDHATRYAQARWPLARVYAP